MGKRNVETELFLKVDTVEPTELKRRSSVGCATRQDSFLCRWRRSWYLKRFKCTASTFGSCLMRMLA